MTDYCVVATAIPTDCLQFFANIKDASAHFFVEGTLLYPTSITVRTKMVCTGFCSALRTVTRSVSVSASLGKQIAVRAPGQQLPRLHVLHRCHTFWHDSKRCDAQWLAWGNQMCA
jgi:hypothetical protein